jgi:pimeloyl-ACP methyl ester carboxylesterase
MNMKLSLTNLLLVSATALGQLIPAPDGPFKVAWQNTEIVDFHRRDPFNSSHPRRMMLSQFTPLPRDKCEQTCIVPYMSPEIAAIEDDILVAYLGDVGWPSDVLAGLEMEICCSSEESLLADAHHKFPTILFGPGHNTTRLFYSATAQQLASLGYNIVVMDHPYETDVVQFPNGDIIFGGRIGKEDNDTEIGLAIRSRDVSFVLDHLGVRKTAYLGQSYGGSSSLFTMANETRIKGSVSLDGFYFGRVIETGVTRPSLVWGATGHNSSNEASWDDFFKAMDKKHPGVWYREISMLDTVHLSYADFSVIGDVSGLRDNEELQLFFGKATGARVMEVMRAYLGDFIEFVLLGGDEGLLAGESDEYEDVIFLRQNS